ncbi:hypothetical protein [Micromonospora phaseoli]|uniref:hypothetical protein n=1 Tax=Micromonospora phaseoli TaxID=1144548 RepID=UPI000B824562|nr:hypothetical protein [Micromonospora phaseoli]GIJ77060.1 hypothetical protein Xph01_14920 [Micromonospora phaseoli]
MAAAAVVVGLSAGILVVPVIDVATGTARPARAGGSPDRVSHTSPFDAQPIKTATATCPIDTVRYAGGAAVNHGRADGGGVALTGIVPDVAGRSVTVTAAARPGYTGQWSLTAYAICESSLEPWRITAVGTGTTTASCPEPTRLFGLGFQVTGVPSESHVTEIAMDQNLTQVRVSAGGPGAETAEVTAIALCRPSAGQMRRVQAFNDEPGWPRTAEGQDTEADLAVYATGATVTGPEDATLDAVVPGPDDGVTWVRGTLLESGKPLVGAAGRTTVTADDDQDEAVVARAALIGTFH